MALSATDRRIISELERDWPHWQIWVVHRVHGGDLWCARRWDGTGRVLNAGTPEHLTEYLEDATAEAAAAPLSAGAPAMRIPPDPPGLRRVPRDPNPK